MDNWIVHAVGVFLALFCFVCESTPRFGEQPVSYVSEGEITKQTAIHLTAKDINGNRFTITWEPVDSWNASTVTSFVVTYSLHGITNKEMVITLPKPDLNAYIIDDVKEERKYIVTMTATRQDGPAFTSNTVIVYTGIVDAEVPPGKWFILFVVMLLWVIAIAHFLRTWRKKMTLRPTYDITSTSYARAPYDVTKPSHSHSYNYMHTQRSNSYTPDLSQHSSGSNFHCSSKSHLSRSFNDLHTVIPEDVPSAYDIPSSSGLSYCRT